jgi:hypothetical protein
MQPNQQGQQGYYRPDQNQTGQPVTPPQPTPIVGASQPIDKAAFEAALAEPVASAPVVSQPQPISQPAVATQQPITPSPASVAPSEAQGEQQPAASLSADDGYDDQLEDEFTWTAKEYIHQEKGTMWFVVFAVVAIIFLAAALFLQQWSFAAVIVVIAIVIVVSSRRPPRDLTYSLSDDGLVVDGRLHEFSSFKAFGVIRDGEEYSVMLIPTKRFQPGVTVYFPEEAGEEIVDILGSRLPMKDLKLDAVDRLVRLLRL